MCVARMADDSVMFLDERGIIGKEGKCVMIMGGAFEGVVGVVRREKRCKRVVVESQSFICDAIAYMLA